MAPSTRLAVALVVTGMVFLSGAGKAQQEGDLPPETLAQSIPRFAFAVQGGSPALVFTHSGTAAEHDPRILIYSRDGWRLIQLPENFHNQNWVYAGRGVTSQEVWAASQIGGELPAPNLELLESSNGGRSWRYRGALQKISRYAVIDYLTMNPSGKGTLVLRLDADPSENAPRLGYYVYTTKNGRDWTPPYFSQNKPAPSSDVLAPPARTFEANQTPLTPDAWQRLFAGLLPAPPAGGG
ncbi:MAG TPA: hypothetical protein VLX28_11205 [Thermoanaerobaculia bacterium]|nr:hypothetical protein [Thermoanaerobaculia bacterium]